jgi:histidyl-tRNA synthetase
MGIRSDMDYLGKSLNSQLKTADKLRAQFAIIIGDDELRNGLAIVKSMDNKTQEKIKFDEVIRKFK